MITLITGTPGAGKTLYTISKLLTPLVGTHVAQEVDGVLTMHPRTIYTNINGLQLDHELIDGGTNEGLCNWQEWARPGSVIVFDEVQKHWTPRANGSVVPEYIKALETHRHMGVDFILITQGAMLIDRNLHMLCGRHLHVRRVANMNAALVYEWDHCSKSLLFKNAITKSPWRYNKKTFAQYKSAQLHTKMPRKMPGVLWFFVLAAALLLWKGPVVYSGLTGKPLPGTTVSPDLRLSSPAKTPATVPNPVAAAAAPASPPPAPVAPELVSDKVPPPSTKFAGCMAIKTECRCYDESGSRVDADPSMCQTLTDRSRPPLQLAGSDFDAFEHRRPSSGDPRRDLEMFAWMAKQSKASGIAKN